MGRLALLALLAVGLWPVSVTAADGPPNWKASGVGTTRPEGGVDVDEFTGRSTHVGRFTGLGFHVLNPADFTFAGPAVWTAANGDTLDVFYSGQIFFSGDPDYPFGYIATIVADGGTGRFEDAEGEAVMMGGFTGVPGNLTFDIRGTLHPRGR